MLFPHCRAYLKFYFICTLNAQKYAHLLSCFLLFFELNVNVNLKFKSKFRKVSVLIESFNRVSNCRRRKNESLSSFVSRLKGTRSFAELEDTAGKCSEGA